MTADSATFGRLYLIPSTLGADASIDTIPVQTINVLQQLTHLIVESPKQARRFLQQCAVRPGTKEILVLDEHTADAALPALLDPLLRGTDTGLISDAGCPAIADPGARLVGLAHQRSIEVVPLAGPSSIVLALMASGLNGQNFSFRGYLPVDAKTRLRTIAELEKAARLRNDTQIFIETPYRNNTVLAALTQACAVDTLLCVAADLTLPTQFIRTASIGIWRRSLPDLHRRPTVFLLGGPQR